MPVLLDDREGRRTAREQGALALGSGGVLVLAEERELIPLVRPVLDELRLAGLHLSEAAYREVLARADELPGKS